MVIHAGPNFSADLLGGRPAALQIIVDGRNSNTAMLAINDVRVMIDRFNLAWAANHGGIQPPAQVETRAWFNPNLESRWKNQRLSRLGLNHARVSTWAGGCMPPWFAAHARLNRSIITRTSLIASIAVLELRPSTMICNAAGRPPSRSALKFGPACITISTCLPSISGAISLSWLARLHE